MYTVIMQKNIGHHVRLKENEHLFCYRAQLQGNFFLCVRAGAHLRALVTRKSCAVGMRSTILKKSLAVRAAALFFYPYYLSGLFHALLHVILATFLPAAVLAFISSFDFAFLCECLQRVNRVTYQMATKLLSTVKIAIFLALIVK